jgi:hypothetical protein
MDWESQQWNGCVEVQEGFELVALGRWLGGEGVMYSNKMISWG